MKRFIKQNFIIILAFLLPVIILVGITASVYLPSFFLSTDYDFIYLSCSSNNSRNCDNYIKDRYKITNGKMVINENKLPLDADKDGMADVSIHIFLHNAKNNNSQELLLREVKKLSLSDLLTSPDGVTISDGYSRGNSGGLFFPFFFDGGGRDYNYYLVKGNSRKKLNLINSARRNYYQNNNHFIGWVIPNSN